VGHNWPARNKIKKYVEHHLVCIASFTNMNIHSNEDVVDMAVIFGTAGVFPPHFLRYGFQMLKLNENWVTSITRPPSSLTEGRRYVTDGVRLAQRPRRGASRRLR
jgi:hypothetical protein